MDIHGKTIVLTGATGGIGRAIARQLSDKGARVILVARNSDRLFGLVGQLGGRDHRAVSADLSSPAGRKSVADACRGGVSLLINCAGINDFGMFDQQSPDTIRRLFEVNLMSPVLLCLELLPLLEREDEARIINIGSTFGSIGYPGFSTYCATKYGLRAFARKYLPATGMIPVIVADKGVFDRLIRHAADGFQQFPRMTGMKGFKNDNAVFPNHEHRVIAVTQRETVDAIADLANAAVAIGSEHTGGGENKD